LRALRGFAKRSEIEGKIEQTRRRWPPQRPDGQALNGNGAKATTAGSSAGVTGTEEHATTVGAYQKGMAVFTVAKGGLMYEATLGGQKFNYKPR
jgi:hypothetical protein